MNRDAFSVTELEPGTFNCMKICDFNFRPQLCSQSGAGALTALYWVLGLCVLLFAVGSLLFALFGKVVPPDYIGVRRNSVSIPGLGPKGYQNKGLEAGLHLTVPGIPGLFPPLSSISLLPRGFQFVHFNPDHITGGLSLPALSVPTKDGAIIKTDLTLVVRYFEEPEKIAAGGADEEVETKGEKIGKLQVPLPLQRKHSHGGPADLLNTFLGTQEQQLQTFKQIAEGKLRDFLGDLATTDFYNPELRERAALRARDAINETVNPYGMDVWAVLIHRYRYDENIDEQIFNKNIQEVTARLNAQATKLAEQQAITKDLLGTWQAKIEYLNSVVEEQIRAILAAGEAERATNEAKGNLALATAEAQVTEAKNKALSAANSRVFVAQEMAPLLGSLAGGVISGVDPYDVEGWMEKLLGTKGKEKKEAVNVE